MHEVRANERAFEVVECGGCQIESSNSDVRERNFTARNAAGLTLLQGQKFTLFRLDFVTAMRFQRLRRHRSVPPAVAGGMLRCSGVARRARATRYRGWY